MTTFAIGNNKTEKQPQAGSAPDQFIDILKIRATIGIQTRPRHDGICGCRMIDRRVKNEVVRAATSGCRVVKKHTLETGTGGETVQRTNNPETRSGAQSNGHNGRTGEAVGVNT